MRLNSFGQIVADEWIRSVEIRQEIGLDEWVIMPNHMHGIVVIDANKNPNFNVGAHGVGAHGDGNGVWAHGRAPLRSGGAHRRPRSLSPDSNALRPNLSMFCEMLRERRYGNATTTIASSAIRRLSNAFNIIFGTIL